MKTIYLASHTTGKWSIFYYFMWCMIHRVHMFHDRNRRGSLGMLLGPLSVMRDKTGGTFEKLNELFKNGEIDNLLMFGRSKKKNHQHFGNGIFQLAKDQNYTIRHLSLDVHSLKFHISDPVTTLQELVAILNTYADGKIDYKQIKTDVIVKVCDPTLYQYHDALVVVMGIVLAAILLFILSRCLRRLKLYPYGSVASDRT